MRELNDELKMILAAHALWARTDGKEGNRANLRGANLREADLREADLYRADLYRANLRGANLREANLYGANLREANLGHVKEAIENVLSQYPNEAGGLLDALNSGCIDGSMYSGVCACLYGTIANLKQCDYYDLPINSSSIEERWFMAIKPGDTPENSQVVKITVEWITAWIEAQKVTV